tara:strand:- start:6420 stop:6974 length:555 start_codon:yes stop_codon:yes gene_type:complete
MSYFTHYPKTKFGDVTLLDITRRAKLTELVKTSALSYMSYTVQEDEKPEDVAFYYYDDPSYAWLVLMSNNIVDPYTHWPKSALNLEAYIKSEYALKSGTTGDAVIEWSKNATIGSNIVEYRSHIDPDIKLNRSSYLNTPTSEFYPVRVYDYEFELNEERREIVLMNKGFLPTIADQLGSVLNDK